MYGMYSTSPGAIWTSYTVNCSRVAVVDNILLPEVYIHLLVSLQSLHQKINMKSCICISNCKDANSLQLTHTTADETWLISLCGSRHKGHLL